MPVLPDPRGPISEVVLAALTADPAAAGPLELAIPMPDDVLGDDDLQLALYLLYELHYRGLPGVDDDREWDPELLRLRRALEGHMEAALRDALPQAGDAVAAADVDAALRALAEADDGGPSLSQFVEREASLEQVREVLVHRSAYQLKEADPHSFALPRLHGRPKAAMVEIQADEYGAGRTERIHATLFATTMRALDLDDTYGAYLDALPGATLATVNVMSLFGLHRRLRGAAVGHLALVEMTSSVPSRRYADGLRRLGLGEDATDFFDEHVVADAVHEAIASVDLAGGLVAQDPSLAADVLMGARALIEVERRWADQLFAAWERGESSLLDAPSLAAAPALA